LHFLSPSIFLYLLPSGRWSEEFHIRLVGSCILIIPNLVIKECVVSIESISGLQSEKFIFFSLAKNFQVMFWLSDCIVEQQGGCLCLFFREVACFHLTNFLFAQFWEKFNYRALPTFLPEKSTTGNARNRLMLNGFDASQFPHYSQRHIFLMQ
jgi:hypothetical protein